MNPKSKKELAKRISFFDYKGHKILYEDYSELNSEDAIIVGRMATEEIVQHEQKSILTVINIKNLQYGKNTFAAIEETKKLIKKEEPFVKKTAVIGIESSVYGTLINFFSSYARRGFKSFKTMEEAREWLIQEDE